MCDDSTDDPRCTGRFREHLRVVRAAVEISGNRRIALDWYQHEPLSEFDGRTAKDLVAEGRADAVLVYLGWIAPGQLDNRCAACTALDATEVMCTCLS